MKVELNKYSISYRDDLALLDCFDTVQFALNPGVHPVARRSAMMVRSVCSLYPKIKVICHYDYNYHITKYSAYTREVQTAFLTEISELTSVPNDNFLGVVVHTDSPYKMGTLTDMFPDSLIHKAYSKDIYNPSVLIDYLSDPTALSLSSIQNFFSDWIKTNPVKGIYLENNVNTCPRDRIFGDPVDLLKRAILPVADLGVGLCLDTEHLFASTTSYAMVSAIQELQGKLPMMVHLNCIPAKVHKNSRLDLHSSTTIFECSQYDAETYMKLVSYLDDKGIPYVREVNKTTREREDLQLRKWQNK